jgi:hypothetical protein
MSHTNPILAQILKQRHVWILPKTSQHKIRRLKVICLNISKPERIGNRKGIRYKRRGVQLPRFTLTASM